MFDFIERLRLVFRYGPELNDILAANRKIRDDVKKERRRLYLNLCSSHQQEDLCSSYSPHNCDYCKLLKGERRPCDDGFDGGCS